MTDWHVGQKVVCINGYWGSNAPPNIPREGKVYTIAEVCPSVHPESAAFGELVFQLEEMGTYYKWWWRHFRPLVEPSIKVFEEILAKLPSHTRVKESVQ